MKYIKLFVIIAFLALLSTEVLAEENNDNVQIQLPEFEITINNQKLEDIEKLYYPFFVYKDIVYIHCENLECLGIRITLSDNILICQKSIDDNLIERDISKLRRGNEVFQNTVGWLFMSFFLLWVCLSLLVFFWVLLYCYSFYPYLRLYRQTI